MEYSDFSPLNPPSHPSRPSQTVSSMHRIDPATGRDSLYLHFYVRGRDKDTELSYWQTTRTAILDGVHWVKERSLDGGYAIRTWWEDLQKEPRTEPIPVAAPVVDAEPAAPSWLMRKLRGAAHEAHQLVGTSRDAFGVSSVNMSHTLRTEPGTWTEGEVHVEMVKDEHDVYQFHRFYIDIPKTSSPMRRRVHLDHQSGDLPIR